MSGSPIETLHAGTHLHLLRRDGWEFVRRAHGGGVVGIVAITDDRKLVLVEQPRIPVGCPTIELPAGLVGDETADENLEHAARRELLEETGYHAEHLRYLAEGPSSAGLTDETLTLVLATGLSRQASGGGVGQERIRVHELPLAEVPEWCREQQRRGRLIDLKVFVALYFAGVASSSFSSADSGT